MPWISQGIEDIFIDKPVITMWRTYHQ